MTWTLFDKQLNNAQNFLSCMYIVNNVYVPLQCKLASTLESQDSSSSTVDTKLQNKKTPNMDKVMISPLWVEPSV